MSDRGGEHGSPRRRRLDAGYTLIELAAVIGIVLAMIIGVFATIQSVRKVDISTSAQRLSASVRYLYDLAVLNNRPYRLVIDLSSGAWWGEAADVGECGSALLPSAEEQRFGTQPQAGRPGTGGATGAAGAAGGAGTAGAAGPATMGGDRAHLAEATGIGVGYGQQPAGGAPAPGGTKTPGATGRDLAPGAIGSAPTLAKDNLLAKTSLPKGTKFSMVMTSHQDDPTDEGQAEIYFFPRGYVERAYIQLKRDDDVYTIETIPLKGIGKVRHEALDPRDLVES